MVPDYRFFTSKPLKVINRPIILPYHTCLHVLTLYLSVLIKEGRPPILSSVKQPLLGVVAHAHDPSACEVGAGRLLRV